MAQLGGTRGPEGRKGRGWREGEQVCCVWVRPSTLVLAWSTVAKYQEALFGNRRRVWQKSNAFRPLAAFGLAGH